MSEVGDSLAFSFESDVGPGPCLAHSFVVTALVVSEVIFPTVSETD
jgi:hypothetical protein